MEPADEPHAAFDALADRLADDVLFMRTRPNVLTRFGDERGGPLGCVVGAVGFAPSLAGSLRWLRQAQHFPIRDDYLALVGAHEARASEDYDCVRRRVAPLSTAGDGDPALVRPAARLLFRYVRSGRPAGERRPAGYGRVPRLRVLGLGTGPAGVRRDGGAVHRAGPHHRGARR